MQIKEIKPINFLAFKTNTTLPELHGYVGKVAKALHLEAAKLGLDVTGPVYWTYRNFTPNPEKPFELEIGIPVAEIPRAYDGKFMFHRSDCFKCLATQHEGSWLEIPATYEKLMRYVVHHQLRPVAQNRELYINSDFQHPEANVTEIQIGIE